MLFEPLVVGETQMITPRTLPCASVMVDGNDRMEKLLFEALCQLIEVGGTRAKAGLLHILSVHAHEEEEACIADITAHLLDHMDFPFLRTKLDVPPTTTELLHRVVEYVEKVTKLTPSSTVVPEWGHEDEWPSGDPEY